MVLGAASGSTQTFNVTGGNITFGSSTNLSGSGITLSLVGTGGKAITFGGTVNVQALAIGGTTSGTAGGNTYVFNNTVTLGSSDLTINNANAIVRLGSTSASTFGTSNLINVTSGRLQFANANSLGSAALNIAGGSIDSNTSNLVLSTTNTITFNGSVGFTGTQNLSLGTNAVSLGTATGTSRTITTTASTLTINGAVNAGTTANSIVKAGAGTLQLNGTSNFTGGVTVSGGLLRFGTTAGTVPGTGTITVNAGGAVATTGPTGYTTFNEWLSSGKIASSSTGALALTADETSAIDLATAGYNSLSIGAAATNVTYSGALTPGSNGYRLGGGPGTLSVPIVLSGSNALTVGGNVTLTSATGNTYTGLTTVSNGILLISHPNALGTTAAGTTVSAGGSLQLSNVAVAGETLTINSVSSGSALPNGLVSVAGDTAWTGTISGNGDGGNNFRISNAAAGTTLTLGNIVATGTWGTITGSSATGLVFVGSGNTTVDGAISGTMGLITTTSGTVTLTSNTSTFTGGVRFQSSATIAANSFNSTTPDGTASANPSGSSLGAPPTTAAATIYFAQNNTSANNGRLKYTGTGENTNRPLALNGNSGTITLEQGGTGNINFTADLIVSATGAKTLTLTGSTSGTGQFSGVIPNGVSGSTMGVSKTGSGTWILSGNNTYTGATAVSAGTLLVNGAIAASTTSITTGGTLGGTGTVAGAVTVSSGSTILGGDGSFAADDLALSNSLTMSTGSTVRLVLGEAGAHSSLTRAAGATGTFTFATAQAFDFINAGAAPGVYDNIIAGLTADPNVAGWTIATPGFAGTFNYDGAGGVDLTLSAVPEPAGLALVGIVATGLLARRRRLA